LMFVFYYAAASHAVKLRPRQVLHHVCSQLCAYNLL